MDRVTELAFMLLCADTAKQGLPLNRDAIGDRARTDRVKNAFALAETFHAEAQARL